MVAAPRALVPASPLSRFFSNLDVEDLFNKARDCHRVPFSVADEQEVNHERRATRPSSSWLNQTSPSLKSSSKKSRRRSAAAGSALREPSGLRRNTRN